jgi:hypothetical protein
VYNMFSGIVQLGITLSVSWFRICEIPHFFAGRTRCLRCTQRTCSLQLPAELKPLSQNLHLYSLKFSWYLKCAMISPRVLRLIEQTLQVKGLTSEWTLWWRFTSICVLNFLLHSGHLKFLVWMCTCMCVLSTVLELQLLSQSWQWYGRTLWWIVLTWRLRFDK